MTTKDLLDELKFTAKSLYKDSGLSIENLSSQTEAHTKLDDDWHSKKVSTEDFFDEKDNIIYQIHQLSEEVCISCIAMNLDEISTGLSSGELYMSFAYSRQFGLIFTNFFKKIKEDECQKTFYVFESSSGAVYAVTSNKYSPPKGLAPYQFLSRFISTEITGIWTNPNGNEEQFIKLFEKINFDTAMFPVRLDII